MALTDIKCRNIKPVDKQIKLSDEKGLFLLIAPSGGKWWRFRYTFAGKEKMISLGTYPDVSLKQAREKRDDARHLLTEGIDPGEHRKQKRTVPTIEHTFESIAREWIEIMSSSWTDDYTKQLSRRLEIDVFPTIGHMDIKLIHAPDIRVVLTNMKDRGITTTTHRVKQLIGATFRYAMAKGVVDGDPTIALTRLIAPVKQYQYATITDPVEVGKLMLAIQNYRGDFVTRCAIRLAPLVFVRPVELRQAEWTEINLNTPEWRIPASKMKMREMHIVPLSRQAVAILREIHIMTGSGKFVFPGARNQGRSMGENTITIALHKLGYPVGKMTGHGFRSMASTLLNEQGWHPDAIERQLAHTERNAVRAAYNRANHLPERRKMMQAWADYLDVLMRTASSDN